MEEVGGVAGEDGFRHAGQMGESNSAEGAIDAGATSAIDSEGSPALTRRMGVQIRVVLPAHLRTLAGLPRGVNEIRILVDGRVGSVDAHSGMERISIASLLDSLEEAYPMLRGTIRAHNRGERRAHLRFFGEGRDLSFVAVDDPLPATIVRGEEPFIVIGAISGG